MRFVVYSHDIRKQGTFIPFYAGKGSVTRANLISRRNAHYTNTINKYGKENVRVTIWYSTDAEDDSFEHEKELISFLRSEGLKLTNATDGGEGPTGLKFKKESLDRMSRIQKELNNQPLRLEAAAQRMKGNSYAKGYQHTEETLKKLAESSLGRVHKEESKKKIGDAQRGGLNHRYGKPSPNKGVAPKESTRELLSLANTCNVCFTDGISNTIRKATDDCSDLIAAGWRQGMTYRNSTRGSSKSEETKARMRAAWEKRKARK